MGRRPLPKHQSFRSSFHQPTEWSITWGISYAFAKLFPSLGQVTYVLLTRAPLIPSLYSKVHRSTCMC
jgi:hypothetical protein